MNRPASVRLTLLLTSLAASVFVPAVSNAQSGYFFEPPPATLSLRVGAAAPSAHGEIFNFFTDQLTLKRGDFRTTAWAGDLSVRVAPRIDVGIGLAYDRSHNRSEFNDWLDQDNQPIEQTTALRRLPLTVSAKYYLAGRGRNIGHHAWVPATFTPYVLAGGGVIFYELEQNGDWVDYQTLNIFTRRFYSNGSALSAHVGAGGEWWFSQRLGLNVEGRYAWGNAGLTSDFEDFSRIDLSGFQATTGLAVRF